MDDTAQIERLVRDHFEAMRWSPGDDPDWDRFRQDFRDEAILAGALRPMVVRTLDGFIDRMETVARASLDRFEEHTRGMKILHWGNVAVALALSELTENGTDTGQDISAYLLVKEDGTWKILAHAWDAAGPDKPAPSDLL